MQMGHMLHTHATVDTGQPRKQAAASIATQTHLLQSIKVKQMVARQQAAKALEHDRLVRDKHEQQGSQVGHALDVAHVGTVGAPRLAIGDQVHTNSCTNSCMHHA